MRYDENDSESKNVEDRRGQGGGVLAFRAAVAAFKFRLAAVASRSRRC